jgi:HEAT repeat protein
MNDARDILTELDAHPGKTRDRLRTLDDGTPIIAALRAATSDRAKEILCDILGARHETAAVEALLECVAHPSPGVRSSAADALAAIGDGRAGPALLARLDLPEPEAEVRRMIVAALGAVGHGDAIPHLIPLIASADPSMRGTAAWSLGALRARAALPALLAAARHETDAYPAQRLREAIAAIETATRPLELS